MHAAEHGNNLQYELIQPIQRIFTYAGPVESAFLFIALVAALASGVALAMVNLVFGTFITVVSDFVSGSSTPEQFRSQVGTNRYACNL